MAQPSLWGNALQDAFANPMTLGGLSLLSGGDLNSGIRSGAALQQQVQQQRQQQAMRQGLFGLPNLTDNDKQILGNSPDLANEVLSSIYKNRFDPSSALDLKAKQGDLDMQPLRAELLRAQIANSGPKPEFQVVGRDAYGQPTYGWTNARTQSVTPAAGSQPEAGALQPPPSSGLSGDAYLRTLPAQEANEIKALAEGRMQIPGGFALKSPYWQRKMSQLSQYDPNFDTVNYSARAATRKDFTSGKSAQNITSFNTAIGHLNHLSHAIDDLNNSDYTAVNAATNATAGVNADRAKKLAALKTAGNAVASELAKAFKGTGSTSLQEVTEWHDLVDPNASPAALKQVVKTATNLLASRIDSVGQQYNKGMGTTSDPLDLLTPESRKIWKDLNPDMDSIGNAGPAAPSSAGPGVDPRKVPVGQVFDYRGHKLRALGNGQFEQVQ